MIKPEMIEKTLSGAVIGCIAGGAYGLFRGFLAQPGYAERLKPRPECFDMDSGAAKLFFDLAKYRYYDEEAFVGKGKGHPAPLNPLLFSLFLRGFTQFWQFILLGKAIR